jgi:hypothetical protein
VRDRLSFESLQEELSSAIWQVDHLSERGSGQADAAELMGAMVRAVKALLVAWSASIGECRRAQPYSPLHPVIDADGAFRWCCNHTPQHCS